MEYFIDILLSCMILIMLIFVTALLLVRRSSKSKPKQVQQPYLPYDDGKPRKFYITGDKHRSFKNVESFCRQMNTRKKDVLIILGDAGFNYFGDERDETLKKSVSELDITLFCIHGNKENRPANLGTYGVRNFCGGRVYYEPRFPNILFAFDGGVYTFQGRKYMVIGGAESIDKNVCIANNKPYFDDEAPDDEIKSLIESKLKSHKYRIYGMLTHTCPLRFVPSEMFLSTREKIPGSENKKKTVWKYTPKIERTTEKWLDSVYEKLHFREWFCGHYHIDKEIDDITMLYNEIRPLYMEKSE